MINSVPTHGNNVPAQLPSVPAQGGNVKGVEQLYQWLLGTFFVRRIWPHVVDWSWVKHLFYWFVRNTASISEALFVAATLWVCFDKNIHPFLQTFLSDEWITRGTSLALMAFVGLPVLLVGVTIYNAFGHFRTFLYSACKDKGALIWMVLYGIPAVLFLTLDLVTAWLAPSNPDTQMPDWVVSLRVVTGLIFGLITFLYWLIGTGMEADRLREKDELIGELIEENRLSVAKIEKLAQDIETLKQNIERQKREITSTKKEMLQQSETALQAYSTECVSWVTSDVKSADIDEIARYTGHNKQKIRWAIKQGDIRKAPGKGEKYSLSSVYEWLKKTPAPEQEVSTASQNTPSDTEVTTDSIPVVTNDPNSTDKLEMTLEILKQNPGITDEELAPLLNMTRPASARFWRLKAQELVTV